MALVSPKHHSANQTGVAEVAARGKNCPGEVLLWCCGVVLGLCGVGVVRCCGVVVLVLVVVLGLGLWCGVGPKELRNWKP